jgi:hypothetical protein
MNDVNRLLEEGILQAIRNLLPVKSILRESLQEDDDDAVQINNLNDVEHEHEVETEVKKEPQSELKPEVQPSSLTEIQAQPLTEVQPSSLTEVQAQPLTEVQPALETEVKLPLEVQVPLEAKPDEVQLEKPYEPVNTFVVDTEKSVGFTGMDSVFGISGDAELRPTIEEAGDEFTILDDIGTLDINEFEDLDAPVTTAPLAADDYETI